MIASKDNNYIVPFLCTGFVRATFLGDIWLISMAMHTVVWKNVQEEAIVTGDQALAYAIRDLKV